jgi:hypothetical protein
VSGAWERSTRDELRAALKARGYHLHSANWGPFDGWCMVVQTPTGHLVRHTEASTKKALAWIGTL